MRPPITGFVLLLAGCPGPDGDDSATSPWQVVAEGLPHGLISVQGSAAENVWFTGAAGTAYHYDGNVVSAVETGTDRDLWWSQPTSAGAVFVGAGGTIVAHASDGTNQPVAGPEAITFFGVWGPSDDDLWAVGGDVSGATDPAIWRNAGGSWGPTASLPAGVDAPDLYYKVHGTRTDTWVVGSGGLLQRWDGAAWHAYECGGDAVIFTVHTGGTVPVAVGGSGQALVCMYDATSDAWTNTTPAFTPTINGVSGRGETLIGVGQQGTVIRWDGTDWVPDEIHPTAEVLHAVWIDPEGGVWAVGGTLNSTPVTEGVLLYQGTRTIPPL